jgi:hypothetical protein
VLLSGEQTGFVECTAVEGFNWSRYVNLAAMSTLKANFFENRHLTFSSVLYLALPQLQKIKHALGTVLQSGTGQSTVTLQILAGDELLELVNQHQWVTAAITTLSLCTAEWFLLFPLQTLKQECDKPPVTSLN